MQQKYQELYQIGFLETKRILKKNFGLELSMVEKYRLREYVLICVENHLQYPKEDYDTFSLDEAIYRFLLYHYGYRMEWQTRLMYMHHLRISFDEATKIFFQDMQMIQDHHHKI